MQVSDCRLIVVLNAAQDVRHTEISFVCLAIVVVCCCIQCQPGSIAVLSGNVL